MRQRFFTSDPHFGHEMVITAMGRGNGRWSDIDAHDDHLIDRINLRVQPDDELYILGDISWPHPRKYRQRIKCKHVKVVLGNHDKRGQLIEVFGEAPDVRMLKNFGPEHEQLFLSHYPHAFWPASHHGSYHLYGHMHMQREATLDKWMPERRSIDVGVDNAARLLGDFFPFSEADLIKLIGDRKSHDSLSFYRKDG